MIWPFKNERRLWSRRPVRLDVMYGAAPPLTLTTSINMSNHSLAFHCTRTYELAAPMEVQVLLDPSHPDTGWFYASGKVARCAEGLVAVEFLKVSSNDADKLDEFFMKMEAAEKASPSA